MHYTTRLCLRAVFLVAFTVGTFSQAAAYQPPIGIPAPPFGIDESNKMYENKTYEAGGFVYRDAGNGPYTHYVDRSSAKCTDKDNPYGSHDSPRCSLPANPGSYRRVTLPAGSVVEIHGGLDTAYNHSGFYNIVIEGTADKPVFIRGFSRDESKYPRFELTDFRIAGNYGIIENLDIYDDSLLTIKPEYDITGANRSDHIAVRYMHIHEPVGDSGDLNGTSAVGDYLVYYKNHVHDNWKSDKQDAHGIAIGENSHYVWILENTIYGNSGNAFQTCDKCSAYPPEYVYIGKNVMHGDKELAIGLKYANNVIISQNILYDYHPSLTATATGIVVGADGATENVWILFNEIYDSLNGIRVEETNTDLYIIGNVIHNIPDAAVVLEKKGPNVYLSNNTINNVGQFIRQTWRDKFAVHARNNIFSNANSPIDVQINHKAVADASWLGSNLFYKTDGDVTIRWISDVSSYATTSDLDAFPGGADNILDNPQFKDASKGNYALLEHSQAIDAGDTSAAAEAVYDTFKNRYGIDIKVDFNGQPRPAGTGWDIGAYEMNAAQPLPPSPPTLSMDGPPVLTSARIGDTKVVIAWSQNNRTPDGGYDILIDGVDTNKQYRTTSMWATITGLDLTQSHCFKVEARYANVGGFYQSNQLCVTADAATTVDTAGADDTAAGGSARLSWTPPTTRTDGSFLAASEIAGYRVYMGTAEDQLAMIKDLKGNATTSYQASGFAQGRTYYFALTAYGVDGTESQRSKSVLVQGANGSATLTSVKTNGGDIVLSWVQKNNIPAGGYDIVVDGVDTNKQYRTTLTTATISGLDMAQDHCFKVEARYTDVGEFYPSAELCTNAPPLN